VLTRGQCGLPAFDHRQPLLVDLQRPPSAGSKPKRSRRTWSPAWPGRSAARGGAWSPTGWLFDLPAPEVAEAYRQLTWIERLWREMKDVMEVRPISHHLKKDNVKGHILVAFLALYLSAMLRRRLDDLWRHEHPDPHAQAPGQEPARSHTPWEQLICDLSQLRALRVRLDGELYRLRTEFRGSADRAFRAVGVRPRAVAEKITAE
jgi:hypothetical protein